jgi:hypothetical protein
VRHLGIFRLKGRVLDALVAVRKRLREMGGDRTPIVVYATEAELADRSPPPTRWLANRI